MLIPFFFKLREGGVPVSITEFLTLLEALQARVADRELREDFYYLARACLVKDERHFDRFDRAFAAHFKGAEELFEALLAQHSAGMAAAHGRAHAVGGREGADRGARRLGQADRDAEASASKSRRSATRAATNGSAPAAPRRSARTATTPKASASARTSRATGAR